MKKRILPTLLAFILLFLAAVPAGAAGTYKEWRMIRFKSSTVTLKTSDPGIRVGFTDNAARENPTYTYTSRDPEIATVDDTGWITPKSAGHTVITIRSPETASFRDGGETLGVEVRYDDSVQLYNLESSPCGTIRIREQRIPIAGESVEFAAEPIDGYNNVDAQVFDRDGYELHLTHVSSNVYRFLLPEEWPVTIRATYEQVLIEKESVHGTYRCIDQHPLPGNNFYIYTYPEEGYHMETMVATDANGDPVPFKELRTEDESPTGILFLYAPKALPLTVEVLFAPLPDSPPQTPEDPGTPELPGTAEDPGFPELPGTSQLPSEPVSPQAPETQTPAQPDFTDVPENSYYAEAVRWAVRNHVVVGTSEHTFSPDDACTRAQAVTMLWRACGEPEPVSRETSFTDLEPGWYRDAVLWAVEEGILNGASATTFDPNGLCTRGQIVTLLWRSHGSPEVSGTNPFGDVSAGAYYAPAVNWASSRNLVNGTGSGQFSPDGGCTRSQIATILYRYMG